MTTHEKVIALAGACVVTPAFVLGGAELFGGIGAMLGLVLGLVVTMASKAWAWQYTAYPDGFANPEFTRGGGDAD